MTRVLLSCPVTERLVPTGYEVEADSGFRRALPRSTVLECRSCGRTHSWYRQEAILEGRQRRQRREIAG